MWLRGHRTGFLLEAMAGVDTALWDLMGKHTGESIGRLLGGRYRDKFRCMRLEFQLASQVRPSRTRYDACAPPDTQA